MYFIFNLMDKAATWIIGIVPVEINVAVFIIMLLLLFFIRKLMKEKEAPAAQGVVGYIKQQIWKARTALQTFVVFLLVPTGALALYYTGTMQKGKMLDLGTPLMTVPAGEYRVVLIGGKADFNGQHGTEAVLWSHKTDKVLVFIPRSIVARGTNIGNGDHIIVAMQDDKYFIGEPPENAGEEYEH